MFFNTLDRLRGRNNVRRLRFLRQSQYWDREHLRRWQLDRLNELLQAAIGHSPFYAKALQDIRLPITDLRQLELLPVLTKEHMRRHFEEIRCTNVPLKDCELSKTGGSTGEPAYYYLSKNSKDWNRGSVYRSAEWAGAFLGDRSVQMMGSHYDLKEFQKLGWKIVFFFQRLRDLPVAYVNDALFESYFQTLLRFKPSSLWGYASGMHLFAEFILKYHPGTSFDFLRAIITSSETLRPHWRAQINDVFGNGKVYDHYGSREVYIASECSMHEGYHIHAEVILLEVVDHEGRQLPSGQSGRILVTDLTNLAFPFVRYEIGDVGALSCRNPCICGLTLPLLERVEGRIADIVVLPDRILTPPNFTILMSDLPGVDAYQIMQDSVERITVRIVRNPKYNSNVESYIKEAFQKLVGQGVQVTISHEPEIRVPPSGKRRFVVSNIAGDYL